MYNEETSMPAGSVTKSCPTLCNPMDCSPPGSSVHGISQARILEWVDTPDPGIKPASPVSPALAGGFLTTEPPESHITVN